MKAAPSTLLIFILIACVNPHKPAATEYFGFKEKEIMLSAYDRKLKKVDSFAKLLIKTPERFDSFFQYQRYPRLMRGSSMKYRFADSRYSVRIENPDIEYYLPSADSLYQLTISHPVFIPSENDTVLRQLIFQDTITLSDEVNILEFGTANPQFIFKDFIKIDNRPFIIAGYLVNSIYRQNKLKLALLGITRTKKKQLTIKAECDAEDSTGFINNMYKSFLSIRIIENP